MYVTSKLHGILALERATSYFDKQTTTSTTLSSGIVLRIGPELSRSRHMTLTALPTYPNLSQIKRHVDFNQYYITKETRLLTTEFPIRTFTLLPLIFHPGSSLLSSILMSLLLLDTNIPASGVSSLFPLSSSS